MVFQLQEYIMHNGDSIASYKEWKRKEREKERRKGRVEGKKEGRREENLLRKYFSFQKKTSFSYN